MCIDYLVINIIIIIIKFFSSLLDPHKADLDIKFLQLLNFNPVMIAVR